MGRFEFKKCSNRVIHCFYLFILDFIKEECFRGNFVSLYTNLLRWLLFGGNSFSSVFLLLPVLLFRLSSTFNNSHVKSKKNLLKESTNYQWRLKIVRPKAKAFYSISLLYQSLPNENDHKANPFDLSWAHSACGWFSIFWSREQWFLFSYQWMQRYIFCF